MVVTRLHMPITSMARRMCDSAHEMMTRKNSRPVREGSGGSVAPGGHSAPGGPGASECGWVSDGAATSDNTAVFTDAGRDKYAGRRYSPHPPGIRDVESNATRRPSRWSGPTRESGAPQSQIVRGSATSDVQDGLRRSAARRGV